MGDPLASDALRGFSFELTKLSASGEPFLKGLHYLAGRVGSPIKGIQEGWKLMSPANALRMGEAAGEVGRGLSEAVAKQYAPAKGTLFGLNVPGVGTARTVLSRTFGAGTHLQDAPTGVLGHGAQGAAEELSRRGWTGQSRATKYLPLGEKAMTGLGGTATAYSTGKAVLHPEDGPGPMERGLGGAAGLATGVMTFGTGGYGLALPVAADYFAGRFGRMLDRQRGQAT
jgi:hypothetical protein